MIRIKRVYLLSQPDEEGTCFLVDQLWPRGVSKESLGPVTWLREVAPSRELREWYGHDPARWEEFCQRLFCRVGEPTRRPGSRWSLPRRREM